MEVKGTIHKHRMVRLYSIIMVMALLWPLYTLAQAPDKKCTIKDGKMHIELSKKISEQALDSFISKYDLFDLDLKNFLKTNNADSLSKLGWQLLQNDPIFFIITKPLLAYEKLQSPADVIGFTEKKLAEAFLNETANRNVQYGYNRFKNKFPFAVKDSIVTFFLRNNQSANQVYLAGTFNKWDPKNLLMTKTDSGWVANVKLQPGKYLYKFIVDDNWILDKDNKNYENDNDGNTNAVFYVTNTLFKLNGFTEVKKMYVAGSFNEWERHGLSMIKTATGWELPLYLAHGTHTYRFVADGNWFADPNNPDKFPNEFGQYNSVIRIGMPYVFSLQGYTNAQKVTVAGSFNFWKDYELVMTKTATGWELPYTLASGNYEYQFVVDGTKMNDPLNPNIGGNPKTSIFVIEPNYTFHLKGFENAKTIYLAGDFNGWSPNGFAMKKVEGEWVLPTHLAVGKHLYKFVVDGKWITDPDNRLWEQNEYSTGNSVLWYAE